MTRLAFGLGALAIVGIGSAAAAQNASIPFINQGGIRDWQAPNERTLYVQGRNRQWFRAELAGVCRGLDSVNSIGFDTGHSNRFDRFSSVTVRGQRCRVTSLERVDGPAKGVKHHPMPEPKK